ncbi:hypothetical protein J6590_093743 [Homalodisca vitripennis]|nr:hypothetical protein J6590_093743 [Homalodisca vitripennis]
MQELDSALSCTSNSAPGPDDVHYAMLRHLPSEEASHFDVLGQEVCIEQECRSSCCNVRAQAVRVYPAWLNESTPGPGDLG